MHLAVPYSAINVILNCIPAAISFKFIGKKFTGFSVLSIVLTGLLVDMLPSAPVTDEVLLNAIFGGIINGLCITICLKAEPLREEQILFPFSCRRDMGLTPGIIS